MRRRHDQADLDLAESVLERFHREVPGAILIGGWAAYLRARALKSHDIDVIVELPDLGRLQREYGMTTTAASVGGRKYKLVIDRVGIDVYPVYQSRLGAALRLPVEALVPYAEVVAGHRTLQAEALFVAKMAGLLDRPDSLAGEKDRRDLWALLRGFLPERWSPRAVAALLVRTEVPHARQLQLLEDAMRYLGEAEGLTRADRQRLKDVARAVRGELVAAQEARPAQEGAPPGR